MVKISPANARDTRDAGWILGLGRCPGIENDNLLQYSCLKNPMDREAWWAIVYGLQKVRHDWACAHIRNITGWHILGRQICQKSSKDKYSSSITLFSEQTEPYKNLRNYKHIESYHVGEPMSRFSCIKIISKH